MSIAELQVEIRKRRVDVAETAIAQLNGQFEFISGQLRDAQRFVHLKFAEHDTRFGAIDRRFEAVETKLAEHDKRFDRLEAKLGGL